MGDLENLKKIRSIMSEMVEIIDDTIILQEKSDEKSDEDIKELESLLGRFLVKSLELAKLGE